MRIKLRGVKRWYKMGVSSNTQLSHDIRKMSKPFEEALGLGGSWGKTLPTLFSDLGLPRKDAANRGGERRNFPYTNGGKGAACGTTRTKNQNAVPLGGERLGLSALGERVFQKKGLPLRAGSH